MSIFLTKKRNLGADLTFENSTLIGLQQYMILVKLKTDQGCILTGKPMRLSREFQVSNSVILCNKFTQERV